MSDFFERLNERWDDENAEWQILKVVSNKTKRIYKNGNYSHCPIWTTIHSVKRLSDGEVFSVGDEFWVYPGYVKHTIKSFRIDGILIAAIDDIPYYLPHLMKKSTLSNSTQGGEGYANGVLNTDEKRMGGKKFLFISDDDVEIFEGDKVWWVDKRLNKIDDIYSASPLEPPHFTNPKRDCQPNETWGMFKWLLNAHKYIDQQKPKPQNNKERIWVSEINKTDNVWDSPNSERVRIRHYRHYTFNLTDGVPDEKLPAIKQAIEQVLNDEATTWELRYRFYTESHPYTEEDLKKAFNASREKNITGDEYDERGVPHLKYKTDQDYLNSLK